MTPSLPRILRVFIDNVIVRYHRIILFADRMVGLIMLWQLILVEGFDFNHTTSVIALLDLCESPQLLGDWLSNCDKFEAKKERQFWRSFFLDMCSSGVGL